MVNNSSNFLYFGDQENKTDSQNNAIENYRRTSGALKTAKNILSVGLADRQVQLSQTENISHQ